MKRIGRNDPCSCGSGRKYKHCCGQIQVAGIEPTDAATPITIEAALEHHRAGRLPQAEAIYRQILQVVPSHPDALHFLGLTAHQAGMNGAAIELIGKAISVNPSGSMYCNLGLALKAQGRLDEAIASYRQALSIKSDDFEALNNLGVVFHEQGRFDEEVASYRQALSIKPGYFEALNNLAGVLQEQRKFDDAVYCYRKALEAVPSLAITHTNLALVLDKQNKLADALIHCRKALDIAPAQVAANIELNRLLNKLVSQWHVPMMNDKMRNDAYFAALRTAIGPNSSVLEIGTGSGLLAMMAA